MTVIVTGGRDYKKIDLVYKVLDAMNIDLLVHGDQQGADTLAKMWACERGKRQIPYPADWDRFGDSAGPIRNEIMVAEHPDAIVVAFPGDRGTQDCVLKALAYNLVVMNVRIGS